MVTELNLLMDTLPIEFAEQRRGKETCIDVKNSTRLFYFQSGFSNKLPSRLYLKIWCGMWKIWSKCLLFTCVFYAWQHNYKYKFWGILKWPLLVNCFCWSCHLPKINKWPLVILTKDQAKKWFQNEGVGVCFFRVVKHQSWIPFFYTPCKQEKNGCLCKKPHCILRTIPTQIPLLTDSVRFATRSPDHFLAVYSGVCKIFWSPLPSPLVPWDLSCV